MNRYMQDYAQKVHNLFIVKTVVIKIFFGDGHKCLSNKNFSHKKYN